MLSLLKSVNNLSSHPAVALRIFQALMLAAAVVALCACSPSPPSASKESREKASVQGEAGEPYPHMPSIAPIGVRIGKYMDVPASAQGPAVDPVKGYRLQDLGSGLYMITDNVYQ
jgi:hypothetical protein